MLDYRLEQRQRYFEKYQKMVIFFTINNKTSNKVVINNLAGKRQFNQ